MPKDPDPKAGTNARWGTEEYAVVPDPIEADTDLCSDTAAEAAGHGAPWAAIDHPAAHTAGPASPGLFIVAGHRGDAACYLASREPVRDEDHGTRFHFYCRPCPLPAQRAMTTTNPRRKNTMSGKHTGAGPEHPEPAAWTPEGLNDARELSQAVLQWEDQRRATAIDMAGTPRPPFDHAVHAHDEDGSAYILPHPLGEARIARMVQAATVRLEPTGDELRTAVQAVAEAVTAEAALAVARAHPDAAVEVEYALWGTPALRYDGNDQDQAALYGKGIPSDDLLEGALAATPGGVIAAASIRAQRTTAAAEPAEPTALGEEKANTAHERTPTADPGLTVAEIAQFRALQAASFPASPGTPSPAATARPPGTPPQPAQPRMPSRTAATDADPAQNAGRPRKVGWSGSRCCRCRRTRSCCHRWSAVHRVDRAVQSAQ